VDLTGVPFLVTVVVLAAGLPVADLLLWSRVRGPRAVQVAQLLLLLLATQLSAVLVAGVLVNNQFGLYESWSDLLGTDQPAGGGVRPNPSAAAASPGTDTGGAPNPPDAALPGIGRLPGGGRLRFETVTGPRSGVTAKLWVLLPAGYDDPGQAHRRYPVVEFFPGYPGTPTTWLHALRLQEVMDAEVGARRVPPFIAVLPTMNVAAPRDTECVDVPDGPQVATWLADDVPRIVESQTRALPRGQAWAMAGYSTGGFCTAKLLLTHPADFGAGAVLAGYFSPSTDVTTGDLFGGQAGLRDSNDPMWLLRNRPIPTAHLLTVYSDQDLQSLAPTKAFLAEAKPPLAVDEIVLTSGGHNTDVWLAVEPQVLRWLGSHLATT
jgi:enterochelin esterase-like enzyme